MNRPSTPLSSRPVSFSPRKSWADWLTVAIFAAILWLPTVDTLTGIDITDQPKENRVPAPAPRLERWDLSGLRNCFAASELYFNDHFGFRKRLVRWFQKWTWDIYHEQRDIGPSVIAGRHGWLFYAGMNMIENFRGAAKFTPAQLQAWRKLLETRRDRLAAAGIRYYFVIPPDKQTIYPEELPAWLAAAAPAARETKLDQFEKYMRAHSTVPVVDLRQPLLAAKASAPAYLKNDTHWNSFGAFAACQALIDTLSMDFPDLPPLRLADFTWTNAPFTGGDLAQMIGAVLPEENYFVFTPKPSFSAPVLSPSPRLATHWLMPGTNATSFISENSAPLAESVVMFHDSFARAWRPFFGGSFKRVLYIGDSREFNMRIIAENHPQIVINEMLERFFDNLDPADLMSHDALP